MNLISHTLILIIIFRWTRRWYLLAIVLLYVRLQPQLLVAMISNTTSTLLRFRWTRRWYLLVIVLLYVGLLASFSLNVSLLLRKGHNTQAASSLESGGATHIGGDLHDGTGRIKF